MKKKYKKTVKAWGVYSIKADDLADNVFTSKKKAKEYYDIAWKSARLEFPNLPERNLRKLKSNYVVIPVSITFNILQNF